MFFFWGGGEAVFFAYDKQTGNSPSLSIIHVGFYVQQGTVRENVNIVPIAAAAGLYLLSNIGATNSHLLRVTSYLSTFISTLIFSTAVWPSLIFTYTMVKYYQNEYRIRGYC